MSYFKKFTDFCTGFAAFSAILYLFRQFMIDSPRDENGELLSLGEKLRQFFDPEIFARDHRRYLLLIGVLILSVTVARIAKKLPAIPFVVSLIPLSLVATMCAEEAIYERPMLYLLLSALSVAGALYETICLDREQGRHQTHLAVNLSLTLTAIVVLCLDATHLWGVAMLLLGTVSVSLLFREVYFLDAALALLPAGWITVLYKKDAIPVCAELLLTVCLVNLIARIALMLSCRPTKNT